jgi:hypothetical protein
MTGALGDNAQVRIERARENVFTLTATSHELSVLVAAARMAYEAMQAAPEPPPAEALEALGRALSDFDSARARLTADPPAGHADPPAGHADRPAGGSDPPEGHAEQSAGGSDPPEGG